MSTKKPATPTQAKQDEQSEQARELLKQLIVNPLVDGVHIQANGLLVEWADQEEGQDG